MDLNREGGKKGQPWIGHLKFEPPLGVDSRLPAAAAAVAVAWESNQLKDARHQGQPGHRQREEEGNEGPEVGEAWLGEELGH